MQIQTRQFSPSSPAEMDAFMKELDLYLGAYSDPPAEMKEALDAAHQSGFLLEALDDQSRRLGLAAITETPFKKFQPRYHLAYIATSPEARGKGAGKALLEKCLEVTQGNLALHVSPKNEGAVAFYEKLGWETKYLRMMPKA